MLRRPDPRRLKTKRGGKTRGISLKNSAFTCLPLTVIALTRGSRLLHACPAECYRDCVYQQWMYPCPLGCPETRQNNKEKKCLKVSPFADDVATGMPALLLATGGMLSWTRVCRISEATSSRIQCQHCMKCTTVRISSSTIG